MMRRHCCWGPAPATADRCLARGMLSSKPEARGSGCRTMRQTDRQTDARALHRPCSTYYAGGVNELLAIFQPVGVVSRKRGRQRQPVQRANEVVVESTCLGATATLARVVRASPPATSSRSVHPTTQDSCGRAVLRCCALLLALTQPTHSAGLCTYLPWFQLQLISTRPHSDTLQFPTRQS